MGKREYSSWNSPTENHMSECHNKYKVLIGVLLVSQPPDEDNQAPKTHVNTKNSTHMEQDSYAHCVWNKPLVPVLVL